MFQQGFVVSTCGVVMWGCQGSSTLSGKHKGLPTLHKGHEKRILSSAGCLQLFKGHVSHDLHQILHLGHGDMQDGVRTCCIVKWQDSDHTCYLSLL